MSIRRTVGCSSLRVMPLGLGCMGMSEFYGATDDAESIATMRRAVELGFDFFDTSDMYGSGHNEELVGRFLREAKEKVAIGTKFGIVRQPGGYIAGISGRPEYVREAAEASLKRLGVETIDLYYYHRVDRSTPIEDTVGAMSELVARGLVKAIGLSEVGVETIRRAHAVHPIAAVQSEYSLWSRGQEDAVIPACRELGITFVAYSPLGRGFLTGRIRGASDLQDGDLRTKFPRFQADNIERNRALLDPLHEIARDHDATPAQIALAWVLAQGEGIMALAGTRRRRHLEENVRGAHISLKWTEIARLGETFARDRVAGDRYPALQMSMVDA